MTMEQLISALVGTALGLRALDSTKPVWARFAYAAVGVDMWRAALSPNPEPLLGRTPFGPQRTGLTQPTGPNAPPRFEERRARSIVERVSFVHEQAVKGTRDPTVYKLARDVLSKKCGDTWCVPEKDALGEVKAIFDEVKKRVRYTWDPLDYDAFQTPRKTLELQTGDCDDYNSLLAAMLRSVGYKVRSRVVQTQGEPTWNHIYLLAFLPTTKQWMPLDLSVQQPAGWEVPKNLIVRVQDFDIVEKGAPPVLADSVPSA